MSVRYEEMTAPRFKVESLGGYEQITLRARRNLPLTLFLIAWLGAWAFGAISATTTSNFKFPTLRGFLARGLAHGRHGRHDDAGVVALGF